MKSASEQLIAQELIQETISRISKMTVGEFEEICKKYGYVPVRKWGVESDQLLSELDKIMEVLQ